MLSLPAPEDTRIRHIQQMQLKAFFRAKVDMSLGYTIARGLARVRCNSIPMQCETWVQRPSGAGNHVFLPSKDPNQRPFGREVS
jgi:hypothetical protein